jgi:hypothetical protein
MSKVRPKASVSDWVHENVLQALLEETHKERLAEVARIGDHVELSLTELLQGADEGIGRVTDEKEAGAQGADGRVACWQTRSLVVHRLHPFYQQNRL